MQMLHLDLRFFYKQTFRTTGQGSSEQWPGYGSSVCIDANLLDSCPIWNDLTKLWQEESLIQASAAIAFLNEQGNKKPDPLEIQLLKTS